MMMPTDMPGPNGSILFEALIVPHRSLSTVGRRLLMLSLAGLCGLIALRFWLLGAWPVIAFCGLEVAVAIFLIHLNARSARSSERVLLGTDSLRVVRIAPSGRQSEVTLSSAWLNVLLEETAGRVPRLLLGLRSRWVEIGAALGESEKRQLATALREALHRMRHPIFDPPENPASEIRRPPDPST